MYMEKVEILTKKMRLRRNKKYLVAIMQPFPMMPHLVTHREDKHLEGLRSRVDPFTPTTGTMGVCEDEATDAEQPPTSETYVVGRSCFTPGGPKGIK